LQFLFLINLTRRKLEVKPDCAKFLFENNLIRKNSKHSGISNLTYVLDLSMWLNLFLALGRQK
jgi:hypothetical protein